MPSSTTNYGWSKPTVGGDSSSWGTELNSSLDGIDSTVHTVSGVANAALPSVNYTAADVLAKIKTVDGTGSGLDADLLQGVGHDYYVNASNLATGTVSLNLIPTGVLRWNSSVASARVTFSSSPPSGGSDGDIWFQT